MLLCLRDGQQVRGRFSDLWRRERLGLTMIVSSVAVIAVTVLLLLNFDSNERVEQLRRQGPSITRILADIPFPELRSRHIDYSPLRILQIGQDDEDFAYAVVVDNDGAVLNAVNSPVVDVGRISTEVPQGAWSGERHLDLPGIDREVLEFFSPVVEGEDIMGTVRIGYFMPSLGLDTGQLPFIGSMALVI